MNIHDRQALKQSAAASLAPGGNHKQLITVHIGLTLALSFLVAVVTYLLEQQIGSTGGLGGVGPRAILETVQSVLQLGQFIVLSFWQFGWLCTAMTLSRQQKPTTDALLSGFRQFAPYLRLTLLQLVIYFVIGMAGSYAATILFMLTPFAQPLLGVFSQAITENWESQAIYAAMDDAMTDVLLPLVLTYLVVFLLLAAPVFYRIRFAPYCLADDAEGKALRALKRSFSMTRGNALALLRLDLSFWWFYALDLLVSVIAYLDLLLGAAGVTLPGPAWVSYFGTLAVYGVFQLLLYRWRKPQVDVTYVKAYESLQGPQPVKKPQNFPWTN